MPKAKALAMNLTPTVPLAFLPLAFFPLAFSPLASRGWHDALFRTSAG